MIKGLHLKVESCERWSNDVWTESEDAMKCRGISEKHGWDASLRLLILAMLFLAVCISSVLAADITIPRKWAEPVPTIDGVISRGEWQNGTVTSLSHGKLVTMNDGQYLYVLVDFVDDTTADPVSQDYYVLAFDVDLNHAVTPNVDLIYDTCQDGRPFVKAYYLSPNTFTGCRSVHRSSRHGRGFGPTFNAATRHRFYEFRLALTEIGVDPATWTTSSGNVPRVRVNVAGISAKPPISFAEPDPDRFPDMTNDMFLINLATLPVFPPGSAGLVFAGVGLVPSSYIDGLGYANINVAGYAYMAFHAPFGGNLNVFSNWSHLRTTLNARRYRVRYSKDGGPVNTLLQTWTNFRYNVVTAHWDPVAFAPDASGRYTIPPPAQQWYLPDLLISWQSGQFGDGTYTLSLELFDVAGNPLPSPANTLTLYLVNTPPTVKINQVFYDGSPVSACAIVTQGPAPAGFTYDISVTDNRGALRSLNLRGIYGTNQSSFVYGDTYTNHINEDGPEKWNGVTHLTVPATPWRAPVQCAYSFILSASSRSQNGYGLIFPYVDYHVSLTVLGPVVLQLAEPCCAPDDSQESTDNSKPTGVQ